MSIVNKLPKIRGKYIENSNLSKTTWFRVGGKADVVFKPFDIHDLIFFMKNCPKEIPVTTIGVGSNILVRDGGIEGVVIRLGKGFSNIVFENNTLDVGAACLDTNIAKTCAEYGKSGLEFLSGIPGTIGGALRMNAGCYGTETKDNLISLQAIDRSGTFHNVLSKDCGFSYRKCLLPKDWVFVSARFQTESSTKKNVIDAIDKMINSREETQPIREKTGGSTFANPTGKKAWELIDESQCRGLSIGGAKVSEKHCNFLINTGSATAEDIENLGELVRKKVREKTNIDLHWEIQRIGRKLNDEIKKCINE